MSKKEGVGRSTSGAGIGRRAYLKAAAGASALTVGTVTATAEIAATEKPNVLFVMLDQLRAAGVRRYGENSDVRTPMMDHIANTGVYFENHVVPNPVCSPTRSAFLTGRYPHATGVIANKYALPPTERTLPAALSERGYRIGYSGKWHLGPQPWNLPDDKHPGYVPPAYRTANWDEWLGYNNSGGGATQDGLIRFTDDGRSAYTEREGEFEPTIQTDETIRWMQQWEDAGEPWYVFTSFTPPHRPFDVPPETQGMYDPAALELRPNVPEEMEAEAREWLAKYYALTTAVDREIRRLNKALHEMNAAHETIVVITGDHGSMLRSHGRRGKWVWYEESIRTPLIVRYPARIAERQPVPGMVSSVDIAPTIAGWTGATLGPEAGGGPVHGQDLSTYLTREEYGGGGSVGSIGDECEYLEGLLSRDGAWRGLRRRNDVIVVDRHGKTRAIYDLEADPYQQNNLAGSYPGEDGLRRWLFTKAREVNDRRFLVGATL